MLSHVCLSSHVPVLLSPALQLHWENKHPKLPFDQSACENLHEKTGGVTTQGVAVRGSAKK
jgi:hypothetical protein